MTEAPGGDGLARALALCALGYSATARERLLPLLHEEMATQVSDWLRRPLSATAATDADAAAIIQSHLFDFDDLTRLRYPGTTTFAGSS